MYHFLSGYTAKVAGTEKGVTRAAGNVQYLLRCAVHGLAPDGVCGNCWVSASRRNDAKVWLVNTGWTGGAYGVGTRMRIDHTRAMVTAVLSGALDDVPYETDTRFNVDVPLRCPDVPPEVLTPRATWQNASDYDMQARKLAGMFVENFRRFDAEAAEAIKAAGPRV